MFELSFNSSDMDNRLKQLQKESPAAFRHALEIAAIQFLTWANNGSSKESRKPPIRRGFLRGSSSAFVGGKLVGKGPGNNQDANISHSEPGINVTWGWNAEYAAKMHEWKGGWGEHTQQDGDAGNKWLEMHLKSDKELFMDLVAKETRKKTGM